jgi:AcrR family transcriptional regulator
MAVQRTTPTVPRRRGRPRLVIDETELLDAVERLLSAGGIEGVSIERTASELGVSRATLYRAVRSKEHLLGRLFRRMTDELTAEGLEAIKEDGRTARERLDALIRVQIGAAIRTRDYLFVFFGREWLEDDVYEDWREFTHGFEKDIWERVVADAIAEGSLPARDPKTATRLMIGMLVWICRWYRPGKTDVGDLQAEAIRLLGGSAT